MYGRFSIGRIRLSVDSETKDTRGKVKIKGKDRRKWKSKRNKEKNRKEAQKGGREGGKKGGRKEDTKHIDSIKEKEIITTDKHLLYILSRLVYWVFFFLSFNYHSSSKLLIVRDRMGVEVEVLWWQDLQTLKLSLW